MFYSYFLITYKTKETACIITDVLFVPKSHLSRNALPTIVEKLKTEKSSTLKFSHEI